MFIKTKQQNYNQKTLGFVYPVEDISFAGIIYIYGTGSTATAFFAWLLKCRPKVCVAGFIDSVASGVYMNLPVYTVDAFVNSIKEKSYDEILVLSSAYYEIEQKLQMLGLKKYRVITPPVYLVANILFDPDDMKKKYQQLVSKKVIDSPKLHLFFGENLGHFVGNNKYFFLYLKKIYPDKVYWVAKDKACIDMLKKYRLPLIDANADDFVDWLNRASHFYFDKMTWQKAYPWLRYFDAKIIHTSHGVGLKYTELMQIPDDFMQKLEVKEKQWLYKNIFDNDLLLSTSQFYAKNVSEPGYGTSENKISLAGYPKNDVLYHPIEGENIFTDEVALTTIQQKKSNGYKVICYTPTCRHMNANHQDKNALNLQKINDYCEKIKALFVLKGHGLTNISKQNLDRFSHLLEYDNSADVYPLLRDTDLLISDYSSIFTDFLHVRKPIIFYPYDFETFISDHNPLQFDYDEMTPGPKALNWNELEKWLSYFLIEGKDKFQLQRDKIFSMAYQNKSSGASERLLADMRKMQLLN
ncbi:MAG: CDP-glycerol glycerophosphotransferase family protein [Pseudomonadota bacterium]